MPHPADASLETETMPRILRIITRLNIGGPAKHATLLARGLAGRGFRSELVSGSESEREGRIEPTGISHRSVAQLKRRIDPLVDIRAARTIHRIVTDRRPHIVHTHLAKAGALGRLAAHRARVPVVIHTFHGHVLQKYFPSAVGRAFLGIERKLAAYTHAFLAVSPTIRDELIDLGVGKPWQWRVVPLGLDLDELLTNGTTSADARARLGLPTVAPLVGIVGRLVAIKGHDTFFAAAARLGGALQDVHFVVAGDGELRDDLLRKARSMLGERVHFLGWVTDLPALYSALDVVVLTSKSEGTPVTLIEAEAAGRPVVATSVGGVADVVRDQETGFVVPTSDPVAVAEGVRTLLEQPDLARAMGAAGRAWVGGRFSAGRLIDEMAALYADLLDRTNAEQPSGNAGSAIAGLL